MQIGQKMLQVTNFKNDNSDISDLNKKLRLKKLKNLIICDHGIGFFSNMIKFLESLKLKNI